MTIAIDSKAILIVEDEAFIRFDLVDFFQDAGYDVYDAEDSASAIVLLKANPVIRIVLTDVQMPGSMDGVKLAHYIRDRYPPTLLVVASGVARPTPAELPEGALFIAKPFDTRSLLVAIERAAA